MAFRVPVTNRCQPFLLFFLRKGGKLQSDFVQLEEACASMATPAQLVETISAATGIPLATVVDIDRKLTKAGLRTKGGRGLSAAKMTPKDAAHLLTAILAAPQSTEAALVVERYTNTNADKKRSSEGLFKPTNLDDLIELPARHSFIVGISAVIASATSGSLLKLRRQAKDSGTPTIEIFALASPIRGRIRIAGLPNQKVTTAEYFPTAGAENPSINVAGDLEQSRRISQRTIFSIAELLGLSGGS